MNLIILISNCKRARSSFKRYRVSHYKLLMHILYSLNSDYADTLYKASNIEMRRCWNLDYATRTFLLEGYFCNNHISLKNQIISRFITKLPIQHLQKLELAAAYKKKQEFYGSYVEMNEFNCENYFKKYDVDKYSKIIQNVKHKVNKK